MPALYVIKIEEGYLTDIHVTDKYVQPEVVASWKDARPVTIGEVRTFINYLLHYGVHAVGYQFFPRKAQELREATNG